jgi:DNA-binding NarL/FixJ family response regulator
MPYGSNEVTLGRDTLPRAWEGVPTSGDRVVDPRDEGTALPEDSVRIVIVDEHQLFRESLSAWLEENAPELRIVTSVSRTSELVPDLDADLALLDIDHGAHKPPGSTGVSTLAQRGLQVVVVSGLTQPRVVRHALASGASGYVSKRDSPQVLVEALHIVSTGTTFLSPGLAALLTEAPDDVPTLSPRELRALRLYSSGMKVDSVARRMGVSPATVREYLHRVKRKYADLGRPARTKTELWRVAAEDGLIALLPHGDAEADDD